MRYVFIVNPTAGSGKAYKAVLLDIENYFKTNGVNFKIIITEYKGQAETLARREAETGDEITVFACGGEGTGYEVINGIYGFRNVTYGVIPCGSANDFVRGIGSHESFLNIKNQIEGESVYLDLIKANDRFCINGCSLGLDASVADEMSIFKKIPFVNGELAYKLSLVKNFLGRLGIKIKLSVDGKNYEKIGCLLAVIANGPYYGGGFMAAPNALLSDGKLDFTLVDIISKLSVLKFVGKYKRGLHSKIPFCHLSRCERMSFESEKPLPVNLDGEIILCDKMEFSVVPGGIKFLVPKGVNVDFLWEFKCRKKQDFKLNRFFYEFFLTFLDFSEKMTIIYTCRENLPMLNIFYLEAFI